MGLPSAGEEGDVRDVEGGTNNDEGCRARVFLTVVGPHEVQFTGTILFW